jgi:DNA-binding transcriptional regulator YdaS (Cro superfamily)
MRNVTNTLLDEIREAKGIASDYALAKLLGVRPQTVSNYRKGRTQMSDEMALRAARMMGKRLAPLLAELAAERATNPEIARTWRDAAKVLARKSV